MDVTITAALDHIVTAIRAQLPEPKNATSDPAKLRVPGVLVQFAGLDLTTLAGLDVNARALVVAGDDEDPDVIKSWEALVGHVLDADLEVTGPITPAGVDLPTHDQPLPALVIPVRVHQE
jgi:hypothetical protein